MCFKKKKSEGKSDATSPSYSVIYDMNTLGDISIFRITCFLKKIIATKRLTKDTRKLKNYKKVDCLDCKVLSNLITFMSGWSRQGKLLLIGWSTGSRDHF